MIENLTGIGYGIIGFAVLIGIGIVILYTFGASVATCPTGYTYNTNNSGISVVNFGTNTCCNNTANSCTGGANTTSASTATSTINTMNGWLGTSSGGLSTWIPIIIVMTIGLTFLAWFLTKKGKSA